MRVGRGDLGWYGIPKVGFFLWRSEVIRVDRATGTVIDVKIWR